MTGILDRIDSAIAGAMAAAADGLCGCGCGTRLDPSGPSPSYASPGCQRRYLTRGTIPLPGADDPDEGDWPSVIRRVWAAEPEPPANPAQSAADGLTPPLADTEQGGTPRRLSRPLWTIAIGLATAAAVVLAWWWL